jgi:hypothetical protein
MKTEFNEKLADAKRMLLQPPKKSDDIRSKMSTFIITMLYSFNIIPSDQNLLDVNKMEIKLNEKWFVELSKEEAAGALVHLVYHAALLHPYRKGGRDEELYNRACDEVVNQMIEQSGYVLPPDVEASSEYGSMAMEAIYNVLEQNKNQKQNNGNGSGNGQGKGNGQNQNQGNNGGQNSLSNDMNFSDSSPSPQLQEAIINSSAALKAVTGKDAGQAFETLQTVLNALQDGSLSWEELLHSYATELSRGNPSYHKFERRMINQGYYFPSNEDVNKLEHIMVAFDVSGSVSEEQAEHFLREIKKMFTNCSPDKLTMMTFNTKIVETKEFTDESQFVKMNLKMGGGTALEPVFEWVEKAKPNFIVVFSDLWCDRIEKCSVPTIWVCIDNPNAEVNFGKLIHVNEELK